MYLLKQSSTSRPLLFYMTSATDHIAPATGLTCTVTLSKNGAAFAAAAGAVSEIGSGWYQVAGNATDTGTLGILLLHATATGADPTDAQYEVGAFDPHDGVHFGLTALPNVAAGALNGLPLGDASGKVALQAITHTGAILPRVTLSDTLTTYTGNTPQTGDAFLRLGAPVGASHAADVANVPVALLDLTNGVETGVTLRQVQRLLMSVLSGKTTESSGTLVFKRLDGTTTSLTVVHDALGNRTASTLGSL